MNLGIIGLGEVGSAIKELVKEKYSVFGRDLDFDEIGENQIEILHICIPYSKKFESIVSQAITDLQPKLTIINSTVKPGTTDSVHTSTGSNLVHAPFMGVHPVKPKGEFNHPNTDLHLFDYFSQFPKVIGPVNKKSGQLATDHFEAVGLKVELFDSAKDSELAKIMSTTYYGWNIMFEKWVHSVCQDQDTNFDQVYTQYNQIYNQGYQSTLPHVVRPVLKHHDGSIGGHCVIPNATIIQEWLRDEFTEFLLTQNNKLKKKD